MFPRLGGGGLPRRDAILFFMVGAATVYAWAMFKTRYAVIQPVQIDLSRTSDGKESFALTQTITHTATLTATSTVSSVATPTSHAILPHQELPPTHILAHAPGWTLFRNLYMSNGTLFIIADELARDRIPEIRMMVSTSMEASVSRENIDAREPTPYVMRVINSQEAKERWTSLTGDARNLNRVWTVEGNTLLSWEPPQFLRHYYHFVAEFIFGVQAFWHGAFSNPIAPSDYSGSPHFSFDHNPVPPIHRLIFAYSNADGWRDDPGFNRYFLRAVMPSLTIEHQEDWHDRVAATQPTWGDNNEKAFHFPLLLLTDRSAAFRGSVCGSTQRIAAEAWEYMRVKSKLMGIHVGGWWAPIREAMWRFAGADEGLRDLSKHIRQQQMSPYLKSDIPQVLGVHGPKAILPPVDTDSRHQLVLQPPEKIVISYVSRQHAGHRKLLWEDHYGLSEALAELVDNKNKERQAVMDAIDTGGGAAAVRDGLTLGEGKIPPEWEASELYAEQMTKDEQIKVMSRTTFLIGVHGNGLSHLIFMNPNRYSTVMEIFYPEGFAHDYQWTTRALGMTHIAVWNDTFQMYENQPQVNYPEGFQGDSIPVYGPMIARLIEERVAGYL